MKDFKVGDRVKHRLYGDGVVTGQDFPRWYFVLLDVGNDLPNSSRGWCSHESALTLLNKTEDKTENNSVYVVYEHTALIPNGTPVMTEVGGRIHGVYKTKDAANKKKQRLARDRHTYISVLTQKVKGQ